MPQNRYAGLDGRAIAKKAVTDIARAGTMMDLTAVYDHLPNEHRARVRKEQTELVRTLRAEAEQAISTWAETETTNAQRAYGARSIGTAAEESRRVSEELRIGRMVESARAGNNSKQAAIDLAEKADAAFTSGNRDEAMVLARAAVELDPVISSRSMVGDIIETVQLDRDLEDPAKAKALRTIGDVDVVVAAFHRDVTAQVSHALQDSATLARAIGDVAATAASMQEASAEGRHAKLVAFAEAQRAGVPYVEPVGVVHGLPLDKDPRGVRQPDGASLPTKAP
jgi:hypothetical protein